MYKILLVNSEKIVMEVLSQAISWNNYDIDEVLQARDCVAALNIIKECRPDIILTDVNLPVMGGLELSSIIKKNYSNIVVIVMDKYEDFPYIKKLSNYVSYLHRLKSTLKKELNDVLQRAIMSLNQNKNRTQTGNDIKEKTAIKNNLFASLINGCNQPESIHRKLAESAINVKFADYFITVFSLTEKSKNNCKKSGFNIEILIFEISNIIEELCGDVISGFVISTYCGNIVLAVEDLTIESDLVKNLHDKIKDFIREFFDVDIIIGMSENYHNLGKFGDAYHEALEQVQKQDYCGCFTLQNINHMAFNEMFVGKKEKLIKSIYACDDFQAHIIINYIYDMECHAYISVKQIKKMNSLLLGGIISVEIDIICDTSVDSYDSKGIYIMLDEMKNLEDSKQFLIDISDALIASMKARNVEAKDGLLKSILTYIDENFHKAMEPNSIAEKFNIDALTLRRMFKEEVGESFSRYMINQKIKKAKQLLRNTKMKVYEIGNYVGYYDMKYFGKFFKESEGVTPLEYRKREQKQHDIEDDTKSSCSISV